MKALQERDRSLQAVYSDLYTTTHNEIVRELESYHHRYGNALGLSPKEASLRVSQYDIEAFADKAKRYVQTKDFSDKANRELKMYNYALRARRDELLQASIQLSMLELQAREEALTERNILKEGLAEYERQAGIMGMSVPDVETMKQTIKVLSQTSYQGATWSDRIWQRQNILQQHVMNIVEDVALRGKSPLEYVSQLRKVFDVGAYEARRLAVTESCRVQTGVQKEVYLNNDFQYYVWSPEPSACPICAAMKGQSFRTTDMQPGVNAPPMHPHCHCTTAPDAVKEREKLEEMFREHEEDQKHTKLDLQMFAKKVSDKQVVLKRISDGLLDGDKFYLLKGKFDKAFKDGVQTPIETINNNQDRYYHIIRGHEQEMFSEEPIDSIVEALVKPEMIFITKDSLGRDANSYVGSLEDKPLLVVTRNDIITAYIPDEYYMKNNILKKGVKIYEANGLSD